MGGGAGLETCDTKISDKCMCSHNKNTLIKQISLFDAANSHDKYLKNFLPITRIKQRHGSNSPSTPIQLRMLPPIWLELNVSNRPFQQIVHNYRSIAYCMSKKSCPFLYCDILSYCTRPLWQPELYFAFFGVAGFRSV